MKKSASQKHDELFNLVLTKIDRLDSRIDNVDKTLIKQEVSLAEHIRRTELAEEAIKILKSSIDPINRHVHMVEGALKMIGGLSILLGIITTLLKLMGAI